DWGISWSKHPLIDAPCNVSGVHIGLDLPVRETITPYAKKDFQIPESCRVMMSGGRFFKFENVDFWKAILRLLSKYVDLHYVAFGVSREQIPFLEPLLTPDISGRVHLLGWREDSLRILTMADILIDTYPSGGGHILVDAMALGIPFVSFENNYMKNFDQTDWSVADEFVSIPELVVPRGDFGQFERTSSRLLDDDAYRRRMGNLCREQIQQSMGDPEAGVRRYEEVIMDILHRKVSRQVDAESGGLGRGGDSRSTLGKWGKKIRDSLTGK
ncbi:MAG TPA: glycosyltransferase, partial [Smithellaceae bacterium]|nr:glycosyltransferase [Smithellaceae bacterium]